MHYDFFIIKRNSMKKGIICSLLICASTYAADSLQTLCLTNKTSNKAIYRQEILSHTFSFERNDAVEQPPFDVNVDSTIKLFALLRGFQEITTLSLLPGEHKDIKVGCYHTIDATHNTITIIRHYQPEFLSERPYKKCSCF